MDVLSTLQECSFRDVSFPVVSIDETFSHDVPQHKSMDRDGAFVENTGRNPFVFAVVAPFVASTLARGKSETWDDLYPGRFELLRNACVDRTTGDFVHPLYGKFRVKATDWKSTLNADERGGQTVSVTFIETRDDGETPAFSDSTASLAMSTAVELDAHLATLQPHISAFGELDEEQSFTDVVASFSSIVDTKTLNAKQALAKIDRTVARLDRVAASIDRTAEVVVEGRNLGALGAGSARIRSNCQVLKSAMYDVRRQLLVDGNRSIATYIVPRATTKVGIMLHLGITMGELLALNPGIVARVSVRPNTVIRYYEAR